MHKTVPMKKTIEIWHKLTRIMLNKE